MLGAAIGPGARVVELAALTRIPTGPAHLLGLATLQGAVIPVVDARARLDLPAPPLRWPLRAHVICHGTLRVAVAVEEILGFEPFDPGGLEPLGDGEVPAGLRSLARGAVPLGPGRTVMIDVPGLVEALRLQPGSPAPTATWRSGEETLRWPTP